MSDQNVAVITGAGSGIGRAAALALAEQDYAVVLAGRTESKLEQTAELITGQVGADHPVLTKPTDVTDAEQAEELIDAATDEFGRLDVLVNVAGFAQVAPVEKSTPDLWRKMIDTNLSSVIYLTAAAWPVFKEQGNGMVVNISSMAARDPLPGFALYGAAKVGVNMFTLMTAREGKDIGVKAVCVAPGAVETEMLRGMFNEKTVPADQCLAPEDVAAVIRDCVTGDREFTSGESIFVNR